MSVSDARLPDKRIAARMEYRKDNNPAGFRQEKH
jgi:hypothetical protein